jgi:hypothetical protein
MILVVGTTRAADLASTFLHDATLSREGNPLVTLLGFGPQELLIANICATLLLMGAIMLYWRLPTKRIGPGEVEDIWQYASFCLYGEVFPKRRFLAAFLLGRRFPRDRCQYFRYLVFVLSWVVATAALLGALSWWSGHWDWVRFRRVYFAVTIHGYPVMLFAVCLAVGVLASIAFFRIEYAEANQPVHRT